MILKTRPVDPRTFVETMQRLAASRVPAPQSAKRSPFEGSRPKMRMNTPAIEKELRSTVDKMEEGVSVEIGRNVGQQPSKQITDNKGGRRVSYNYELRSPFDDEQDSGEVQIVVSGLNNRVTVEQLEKLFAAYGDAKAEIASEPSGIPGQLSSRKKNYGRVYMTDAEAAERAIAALNMKAVNGTVLRMTKDARPRTRPGDSMPSGNPDSLLAWDVFLRSPFIPSIVKDRWLKLFDIVEVYDPSKGGKPTYARRTDATPTRKKVYDWWKSGWAYRMGQAVSRPIDVLERWGKEGKDLSRLLQGTFYEAMQMAGEGQNFVRDMYTEMYNDPVLKEYLDRGDNATIEHHRGFLPTWVKKVPGIEIRVDKDKVEKVYDRQGNSLTKRVNGVWITELRISNRPLLDAWVNAHFRTQDFGMIPPQEVSAVIEEKVSKIRGYFDGLDKRLLNANLQILSDRLAGDTNDPDMYRSITTNQTIDKEELIGYASSLGIEIPDTATIRVLPPRGNMREWVVIDGVKEIYRVREFDPMLLTERDVRHGSDRASIRAIQRSAEMVRPYEPWVGKTLIYEPEPREPIWSYREDDPFQLYAGRPHDLPQMINWSSMDPYNTGTEKYDSFMEYLDRFYESNRDANPPGWEYQGKKWSKEVAKSILERNYFAFHDMRFSPIEGDSELIYPAPAYESEAVLGEYAIRAGQRVSEILNYGQQGDILTDVLDAIRDPERLDLPDVAKSVLKLRQALGHNDFKRGAAEFVMEENLLVPYTVANGQRQVTRPEFDRMTPKDWDLLVQHDIVSVVGDAGQRYYAWGDPTYGRRRTHAVGDQVIEFTVAPNAGALVNMPMVDPQANIMEEIELATQRYEIAKATVLEHHTWHPKLVGQGELQQKLRMMASEDIETRKTLLGQIESDNEAYYDMVFAEQEKLRNPVYKALAFMQRLATGLFMRLSWAVQVGTFHNPAHRTGVINLFRGVRDQIMNEKDRVRLKNLGAMVTEMTEVIALQAQSISQENLGFNQKMLGASKYWRWTGHGGGILGWMNAFYNRGNWTPFAWMERNVIRGTAAMAGKHLVRDVLSRMLTNPPDYDKGRRAQDVHALTELNVTIEPLLDAVMQLPPPEGGWTPELIAELVDAQSSKDVQAAHPNNPEWGAIAELTNRVMQVMPDYAHYQGSNMHTPRILRKHPFLGMMLLFQRVMVAQMGVMLRMLKFGGKQLVMPMQEAMKDDPDMSNWVKTGMISKELLRKMPHLSLSLSVLLGSGFAATMMANLVRFQQPDDEDLMAQTWLMNSAVFGVMTGFIESHGHYRGITRQFGGPVIGLGEDLLQDFTGTVGFYGLRPLPVDFRPALSGEFWSPETPHDLGRTHQGGGGYRAPTGSSLGQVRVP